MHATEVLLVTALVAALVGVGACEVGRRRDAPVLLAVGVYTLIMSATSAALAVGLLLGWLA